jgi:hypothetical protein
MKRKACVITITLASMTLFSMPAIGQSNNSVTSTDDLQKLRTEVQRLQADNETLRAKLAKRAVSNAEKSRPLTATLNASEPKSLKPVTTTNLATANGSTKHSFDGQGAANPPFVILRQDAYDEVSFAVQPRSGLTLQGASFSYTKDEKANTQSASINGFVGASLYNWESDYDEKYCSSDPRYSPRNRGNNDILVADYGFGPFVYGDGTYNQPTNANEKSALRGGIGAQSVLCNLPIFPMQDFQLSPYAQTDFRGKASIFGFDSLWEMYNLSLNVGGRSDFAHPKLIGYYFRFIGEANFFDVDKPGLTNFAPNKSYGFLGGTTEVRSVLFENDASVPAAICGRISVIGTERYLWDAFSSHPINLYGASVAYNLSGQTSSTVRCQGSSPTDTKPSGVGATVALTYTQGTDAATLVKQNVYKASLKLSF